MAEIVPNLSVFLLPETHFQETIIIRVFFLPGSILEDVYWTSRTDTEGGTGSVPGGPVELGANS